MRTALNILAILFPLISFSQIQKDNFEKDTANMVYFDINSTAFFDNLEFVNNIEKGYTLTGFNIEPKLKYSIGGKYSFSAGAHALYYAGEAKFERFVPVLTISAKLNKAITLNIGTIDGSNCHGLPQFIFKREREYISQPETGMQFVATGKWFDGETWINWEKFLFFGDSIQEEFTVGISGNLKILENDFSLKIPIYALAVHQGGQIDISDKPVTTLANIGGGLSLSHKTSHGHYGIEGLMFLGRDLSPEPHHVYKKGWAIFPRLFFRNKHIMFDIGYWISNSMILPRGQDIFGSVSLVDPFFNSPKREILTSGFNYTKELAKGFKLSGIVDLYHVISESQSDYRFAVVARFNEDFILKRLR